MHSWVCVSVELSHEAPFTHSLLFSRTRFSDYQMQWWQRPGRLETFGALRVCVCACKHVCVLSLTSEPLCTNARGSGHFLDALSVSIDLGGGGNERVSMLAATCSSVITLIYGLHDTVALQQIQIFNN